MTDPRTPTRFALGLEDFLSGWIVPGAAVAAAAVAAVLYLAGALSESATAAIAVLLVAALAALLMARHAIAGRDPAGRLLALLAAAATAALVAIPAIGTVLPGAPLVEGTLGAVGDQLPLPPGLSGAVRVLVRAQLPPQGTPRVSFRIGGGRPPVEGQVERTLTPARVGRGGRTMVAHERSSEWLETALPAGGGALRLEKLQGEAAGPLAVEVFHDPIPGVWLWLLSAAVILVAAAADARIGGKDHAGAIAGMALVFGILVTDNATPQAAIPTVLGGLLLGAMGGAAAGWVAGLVARRVVPGPSTAGTRAAAGARGKGAERRSP